MNARSENRLNMYLVVINYLNTLPPVTLATMPQFVDLFNQLKQDVQLLRTKNEAHAANNTGYRINKLTAKENLATYALFIADCIKAYALSVNNIVLLEEMKFNKSILYKQRDTQTADEAKFIATKAANLITELTPFGITQTQINQLNDLITAFNTNIPLPRVSINKRKLLTKDINDLLTACNNHITRMDNLINILKFNNPTVYTEYYYSRKTVNNHGKKLALRGTVTDTMGNPISQVQVTIQGSNKTTKTTNKGYYEFKNLPPGLQTLTFTQINYQETTLKAAIISSKRTTLNATLQETITQNNVA